MGLVPLPEGSGINLDDGRLDEGVGSDKLVVGGVVRLDRERKRDEMRVKGQLPLDGNGLERASVRAIAEVGRQGRGRKEESSTHNSHNSGLLGAVLGSPGEVSRLESESSVLDCFHHEGEREEGHETPSKRDCELERKGRSWTNGFHLGLGRCGFAWHRSWWKRL